jgi:hypothetical protein
MFRRYVKFVVVLLSIFSSSLFAQWSDIVQITSGEFDDRNPVFASLEWPSNDYDWVVFTRTDSTGTNICVKRTTLNGRAWENDVTYITQDSFFNTSPSIAQQSYSYPNKIMIVWQTNRNGNNDIYYSFGDGLNWSLPMPISTNSSEDINPQVAVNDTNYIIVWECEGRIKSSIFSVNDWLDPIYVTHPDSINNSNPKIASKSLWGSERFAISFWEKRVGENTQINYATYNYSSWIGPTIFSDSGINTNISIAKMSSNHGILQLLWERHINNDVEVFYRSGYNSLIPFWYVENNLSEDPINNNGSSRTRVGHFISPRACK